VATSSAAITGAGVITGDCNSCTGDCVCTGNCNSCTENCNCGGNANACTEYCTAGKNANACTTNCAACGNANACTTNCTTSKNANACVSGCSADDPSVCGAITQVCAPGTTQCDPNSNGVDTCTLLGAWGTAAVCVNQACVGGACIGVCAPGATRCDPNSNGVDTCSASGQWGAPVACNNQACLSGATGAPDPGACTGGTQLLPGHALVGIGSLPVVSPLPPSTQLTLGIALPTNQSALQSLVAELGNPSSPQYHQYLTPAQFANSFGASQSDYDTLVSFVQSSGLTVTRQAVGRDMLEVSGTVAAIESMFFVPLNVYRRADGTTFHAPAYDPSVNLSVPILFVSGLDNFARPIPANGGTAPVGCGFSGAAYGPTDLRTIYMPCATSANNGSGQTIGLFEVGSYYPDDVADYYQFISGTASPNVTTVQVPANESAPPLPALSASCTSESFAASNCLATSTAEAIPSCADAGVGSACDQYANATNEDEVALDIQMALAMAPGATIRLYEQDPESFQPDLILSAMADEDVAQQISSSWQWSGGTTDPAVPGYFLRFAIQGQSVFWSSGDRGAYITGGPSPYVIDPIIDSANMTVVGGTHLTTTGAGSTTTYSSETTWNDAVLAGCTVKSPCNSVSGGGFCAAYSYTSDGVTISRSTLTLPAFQSGLGTSPPNTEVTSNPDNARMIPDVSMIADDLFIYQDSDACYTTSGTATGCSATGAATYNTYDPIESCSGGTSAAAPLWAGIAALINQASVTGNLGFANPKLYALAAASAASYASNFHDVSDDSNNNFPSSDTVADTGAYHALQGYDLATGLGSPACTLLAAGGVCVPGTTQCTSETQIETCSTIGVWTASTCPDACVGTVETLGGNCGGVCVPGTTECTSGTQVATCNGVGQWSAPTTCSTTCIGAVGTVGGNCGGCVPGATQCTSEADVETCGSNGQWGAPTTCPDICVGTVGTLGGACGGVCLPGAQQCVQDGDACVVDGVATCSNDIETCTSSGQWGAATPCTYGLAQNDGPYGISCIPPGSAGSTTHSNGTGQNFTDCSPTDTYTSYSAFEACLSLIEVNSSLAAPTSSCADCGGWVATFYGGNYYSWTYHAFIYPPTGTTLSCSSPVLSQYQEETTEVCSFSCSDYTLSTWN
jgi:hypothetical protein